MFKILIIKILIIFVIAHATTTSSDDAASSARRRLQSAEAPSGSGASGTSASGTSAGAGAGTSAGAGTAGTAGTAAAVSVATAGTMPVVFAAAVAVGAVGAAVVAAAAVVDEGKVVSTNAQTQSQCNAIIGQDSSGGNNCATLKYCYDTFCGCSSQTTSCQQWQQWYKNHANCVAQCNTAEAIRGLELPSVNLFSNDVSSRRRLSVPTGTNDYNSFETTNFVSAGPATDILSMVNFLICVLKESLVAKHPNKSYKASIDENACNYINSDTPAYSKLVITTLRASNTAPFVIDAWVTTYDGATIVVKAEITTAPSSATPQGVLTFDFNFVNTDSGATGEGGHLELGADNTITYIEKHFNETGQIKTQYMHGTYTPTSNSLRVQTVHPVSGQEKVYNYISTNDNIHYKPIGGTAVCLTTTDPVKVCFEYALFDNNGMAVDHLGSFGFTFMNGADGPFRGWWAGGSIPGQTSSSGYTMRAWIDVGRLPNGFTLANGNVNVITRNEDGMVFTLAGNEAGPDGSSDTPWTLTDTDGVGYIVDTEIYFNSVPSTTFGSTTNFQLSGTYWVGHLGGVVWELRNMGSNTWIENGEGVDSTNAIAWRPKYTIASEQEMQDSTSSTKYYLKQKYCDKTLQTAEMSVCSNMDLSEAPVQLDEYVIPTVSLIWANMPTVANGKLNNDYIQVIHGEVIS